MRSELSKKDILDIIDMLKKGELDYESLPGDLYYLIEKGKDGEYYMILNDWSASINIFADEVCLNCKHLIDGDMHKCKAFDRIPKEIWYSIGGHKKPYPGDRGIQYEPDFTVYNKQD